MASIYLLLVPLLAAVALTRASIPGAVQFFVNSENSNSHLEVDRLTGDVFVGAANKIFKLDSDLQVVKVRSTGPVEDSPECLTYYNIDDRGCENGGNGEGRRSDNWNKALVIDQQNRILIHCGTAYHGVCWTTPIDAFTTDSIRGSGMVEKPVVGNDKEANVVTMVVPGENWAKVLGFAVTNTGRTKQSDVIPAISFRQLRSHSPETLLDVVTVGASSRKGEIRMTAEDTADFRIKYVYGFESRGFYYWLAVQPRSFGLGFETKLIRQCQRDASYKSYVDIKIGCVGAERAKKFNVATAAVLGKAGTDLGDSLGLKSSGSVLYVAFSAAISNSTWEVEKESALCVFSMEEIRKAFEASWNDCFSNRKCKPASYVVRRNGGDRGKRQINVADGDCARDSNTPLEGSVTLLRREAVNVHDKITALAANATGRFTVVFAGTERGAFKKLAVEKEDSGYEYETVLVDSQRAVLSDLEFDRTGSHLYVMTKHKVTKFQLHTKCSVKKGCGECFEDGDPFCGWCTELGRCMDNSQQTQCPRSYNASSTVPSWVTYKEPDSCPQTAPVCSELAENCGTCTGLGSKYNECGWCPSKSTCVTRLECPVAGQWVPNGGSCGTAPTITKFEPMSGPLEGGTNVSIVVPNLYSHIKSFVPILHVTVADTPCKVFQPSNAESTGRGDDVVRCRVTKTVGRPNHNGARSGPIVIQVQEAGLNIESSDKFHLVNPLLGEIFPKKGSLRGGARLKISGVQLDAGRAVEVFLGSLECRVLSRSSQEIQCITPPVAQIGQFRVRVELDGNERVSPDEFEYVEGAEVFDTKPSVIHGTPDGGQHFEVFGTNFNTIQVAEFVVIINKQGFFGECSVTSDTLMTCTTPAINGTGAEIRAQVKPKTRAGFSNDTDDDEDGNEPSGMLVLRYFFRFDTMETYVSGRDHDKHEYYLSLARQDEGSSGLTLFISISLVILFIICSATLYIVYRRYGVSRRNPILPKALPSAILTRSEVDDFFKGKPNTNMDKGVLKVESPYIIPYNDKYEISEKRFTIDRNRPLGSGMFGLVLPGKIDGIPTAVKTLKPDAEKMHLTALMSELKILVHLAGTKHPHVVNLVGAYTKRIHEGTLYMFVEYCPFGSLDKRLRNSRPLFCNQIQDDVIDLTVSNPQKYEQVDARDIVCTFDLVNYAHQIAKGMEYLAEKKVIHADLAARNILLVNQTTVKITDFGLARKLYDYTNYVKKQQEPLPWRWMALESLQDLSFSTQSDVWAYGVTLWEMFTLGEMPYPGLSWSVDFPDRLVHGLKNVKPKFATSDIYNTMQECWQLKPEDRPSFADLRKFFNALLQDLSSQVQEAKDEDGYLMPLLQRPNSTNV